VLPSSVYRIEAPDVVVSVIAGAPVQTSPPSPGAHPPPEMPIAGVAIVPVIVYDAMETELSAHAALYAIALMDVELATAIAPVYSVPRVSDGVEPSVVYRKLAPGVLELNVTDCALV
jgi:hypothetical protein